MANRQSPQQLSSSELLELWETAYRSPRRVRTEALLYAALTEKERHEIMNLCIGEIDAFLLQLYRSMFGNRLECTVSCPACSAILDLTLTVDNLLIGNGSGKDTYQLKYGEPPTVIYFRLPARKDFLSLHEEPHDTLRKLLVERCVLYAEQNGEKILPVPLTNETIDAVSKAMSREDPQAEIILNMQCSECRQEWQTIFDIIDFFWQKINAEAKTLITEIHLLAQAYGWTEAEILALSRERRKLYIELVS